MSSMKAVLLKQFGDLDQMYIGETTKPSPKPDEILVRVKCTAINRADTLQRRGKYPPPKGASEIMGLEVSGVIEQLGSNVEKEGKWKVGDKVMSLLPGGGYAQYTVTHKDSTMKIPNGLSFEEAAGIPEVFLTAYQTVFMIGGLKKNDKVLIHAGGSGVGTAAIQLAKSAGASQIITTSSASKIESCKKLGATLTLDYKNDPDWDKTLLKECPSGVDVILDCIGKPYFTKNINVMGLDGRLVMIAMMGGSKVEFNLVDLFKKRGTIVCSTLRSRDDKYKGELVKSFMEFVGNKFETGELKPVIDSVMDWKDVKAAHLRLEENKNVGKVILRVE